MVVHQTANLLVFRHICPRYGPVRAAGPGIFRKESPPTGIKAAKSLAAGP
jgi:hypothetical protein